MDGEGGGGGESGDMQGERGHSQLTHDMFIWKFEIIVPFGILSNENFRPS